MDGFAHLKNRPEVVSNTSERQCQALERIAQLLEKLIELSVKDEKTKQKTK